MAIFEWITKYFLGFLHSSIQHPTLFFFCCGSIFRLQAWRGIEKRSWVFCGTLGFTYCCLSKSFLFCYRFLKNLFVFAWDLSLFKRLTIKFTTLVCLLVCLVQLVFDGCCFILLCFLLLLSLRSLLFSNERYWREGTWKNRDGETVIRIHRVCEKIFSIEGGRKNLPYNIFL